MRAESADVAGDRLHALIRRGNREHHGPYQLGQAEQARLAWIVEYSALCKACPDQAAGLTSGTAAIIGDHRRSVLLARQSFPIPGPSAISGLATATRRLLALKAVRGALVEPAPAQADPVGAFWKASQVVALKVVECEHIEQDHDRDDDTAAFTSKDSCEDATSAWTM